ncbi:MAG: hypothetical protein NC910_02805 [Candidatus Omnitrophica bacterium]|nr:hypothetical protein [Candidatus Omnitrophota bacterium]
MSLELKTVEPVLKRLEEAGFCQVEVEVEENILILKLPAQERSRLLMDQVLRESLTAQTKQLGFLRLTLELSP